MARSTTLRRLFRSSALRSTFAAVLVVLLLAAETFAVVHRADLAAHSNGDPCKICVSVAAFDGAVAAHVPILAIEVARPIPVAAASIVRSDPEPVRQTARGPPLVS